MKTLLRVIRLERFTALVLVTPKAQVRTFVRTAALVGGEPLVKVTTVVGLKHSP